MGIDSPSIPKRVALIKEEEDVPKQRKRSRTGGSKDLYEGHSQDVMLAKTLIDPDHQCSVTTVKAYVTHVCAWFRYCRTLPEPNYTLVNEEKLSGFLTWATQTPRLPCKTAGAGGGGSMSYQSARRYVEGGILALWRRYRKPDDENPLHALSYLNTKYAIREATSSGKPKAQPERHYSALAISQDQEDAIIRTLLSNDYDVGTSIRAWAYYCLGASTWIPGSRRLHLRLDSLAISMRTDSRLVEHTTVPFVEFRVNPDPASPTARFAEVSIARHINPILCPWYAISLLIFLQWQAQPSAMAAASLYDMTSWLNQPLFLANTEDSLVFLPDDTRVQMVLDEIAPLLTQAHNKVNAGPESHIIRRRDKMMAESLGLSAPQVVRLEKWRVHHRRPGVTRQQTFFDLTLVLGGQNPPPSQTDVSYTFRAPSRTRLQVPEHLLQQVFPWLNETAHQESTTKFTSRSRAQSFAGGSGGFVSRQRSYSMSTGNSDDVVRAERNASLRFMRELATVLLQDSAALLADPHYASIIESHPLFQAPLFRSRAFRDFCSYANQALSLQHIDIYSQNAAYLSQAAAAVSVGTTPSPVSILPPVSPTASTIISSARPSSSSSSSTRQSRYGRTRNRSHTHSYHHSHHQRVIPPTLAIPHTSCSTHHISPFGTPTTATSFSMLSPSPHQTAFPGLPPYPTLTTSINPESLLTTTSTPFPTPTTTSSQTYSRRRRCGTFEPIGEEEDESLALAKATLGAAATTTTATAPEFNPTMLLSQPLAFPPQLSPATPLGGSSTPSAFPQLLEDAIDQESMSQQDFLQLIDYLSVYNNNQQMVTTTAAAAAATPQTLLSTDIITPSIPTFPANGFASQGSLPLQQQQQQHQQQHQQNATSTDNSSESTTASPELSSASSIGLSKQQSLVNTDPMLLLHGENDQANLSIYLNTNNSNLVDTSALLNTEMALPKNTTSSSQLVVGRPSPTSTSPTPTPSASSPSLHSSDHSAGAMQFSIAPYKLQFKADQDLFLH